MMEIRKSNDRGIGEHGWLYSQHSFSFANYYDPNHMGFGPLRVINEDRIQPGHGFGTHGHNDMEIITYVLDGALEHKDSMGTGSVIKYGDVQRMSAGSGVQHSEFNHSKTESVHLLQIWIMPNVQGIEPSYEEKHFTTASKQGQWRLIVSPGGQDGSIHIHQDAKVYASILGAGDALNYALAGDRCAYIHIARGKVMINKQMLDAGDALKLVNEPRIDVSSAQDAEILLFDLPR